MVSRKQAFGRLAGERLRWALGLAIALQLAACAPMRQDYAPNVAADAPRWAGEQAFVTRDGRLLAVRHWPVPADRTPTAVVIALHGVNDHAGRFSQPAKSWALRGLSVYAYDQRGFGEAAAEETLWPGSEALINDLIDFSGLVAERHPDLPIILLGESMGGAIVISAMVAAN